MSITSFKEELASTFSPEVLFKANTHKRGELYPKAYPEVCRSAAIVEGDGGVGSVGQMNFTDALPFKYWKERIDILDEANFEWKVTIIEGGHIGTELEWAWYHVKLVPAPGGGSVYKISSQHKSLSGKVYSEADIEADKNGLLGLYKALDAYLAANPGSV